MKPNEEVKGVDPCGLMQDKRRGTSSQAATTQKADDEVAENLIYP